MPKMAAPRLTWHGMKDTSFVTMKNQLLIIVAILAAITATSKAAPPPSGYYTGIVTITKSLAKTDGSGLDPKLSTTTGYAVKARIDGAEVVIVTSTPES